MPLSPPLALQPGMSPWPTPMSADTTARCRSGSPSGSILSTSMKRGKLACRLACDLSIEDELSIMNKMSIFRFRVSWKVPMNVRLGVTVGASSDRELQAHSAGTAIARPAQRITRQGREQKKERAVMGILLERGGRK